MVLVCALVIPANCIVEKGFQNGANVVTGFWYEGAPYWTQKHPPSNADLESYSNLHVVPLDTKEKDVTDGIWHYILANSGWVALARLRRVHTWDRNSDKKAHRQERFTNLGCQLTNERGNFDLKHMVL